MLKEKTYRSVVALFVVALAISLFNGCRNASAPPSNPSASQTATPAPRSVFEQDLQSVRNSQTFNKIYVFARKDGGAIESADGELLKTKAPADPHIWWLVTDARHRVIMGTYSDFAPEKLDSLGQRFTVEDYTNR